MNNVLKFKTGPAQNFFFSSDFHLGHSRDWLYQPRGFNSILEHDEGVIKSINDNVAENDVLFYLGDFCLNATEEQFHKYIDAIKCRNIYMLYGNHNSPVWPIYKREVEYKLAAFEDGASRCLFDDGDVEIYPFRYKNIVFCGNYLEIIIGKQVFVLCHYPIYSFNYQRNNSIMLCGHSHKNCELSNNTKETGRILDTGWDGFKKPLSYVEIMEIMKDKKPVVVDHH